MILNARFENIKPRSRVLCHAALLPQLIHSTFQPAEHPFLWSFFLKGIVFRNKGRDMPLENARTTSLPKIVSAHHDAGGRTKPLFNRDSLWIGQIIALLITSNRLVIDHRSFTIFDSLSDVFWSFGVSIALHIETSRMWPLQFGHDLKKEASRM